MTVGEWKIDALCDFLDERLAGGVAKADEGRALLVDALITPRGLQPQFVDAMEAAGPYGMGWPGPRVVAGPVRVVKCDIVGKDHVRVIVSGDDGASFKAMAFRQGESDLGQTLLHGAKGRKFWLAGRAKIDDWGSTLKAELHIDDAAFAD